MVTAFAKCGKPRQAQSCFRGMWESGRKPTPILFATVLGVCAEIGELEFRRSVHEMIRQVEFCTAHALKVSLFDMYSRCGELDAAKKMFDSFKSVCPTTVNKMIAAFALRGQHQHAIDVFDRFRHLTQATDANTFVNLLGTCRTPAEAEEVYEKLRKSGIKDDVLRFQNALISKLGRFGDVAGARKLLEEMPDRNVVSWSAMIAAYVQNGCPIEAMVSLREMDLEGVKPSKITFTSLVDAADDVSSARSLQIRIFAAGDVELDVFLCNAVLGMPGSASSSWSATAE